MKTTKLLSLIVFLLCFTLNLRAQSGTCGANLTWELTDSTLTISGSGAMDNSHPWSSYSSQIARVSLPEGLTNICDDAFYACPNLQSIVIPNTVTSIGRQAFSNCTSLKQVTLSNAVETIGHSAFSSTSITSITLPSSVTSIEDYAFSYCRKLTEITIPGSVSSIGNYAFQYCEQLSKATIEEGVKSIGNSTFYNCNKMTNIALPSSLISIGSNAFYNCLSLTSIVIPEQITTIEGNTFEHCSSLKEITLPSNLQTIGNYAFSNCGFTHIDIPNSVTDIKEYAFYNCTNLTSVILPSNLKSVKTDVFKLCSILSSVTIPEGVTVIHGGAFYGCNLTELILPNSLERIGDYSGYSGAENGAFANNTNLTTVVIPKNVSKIGSFAFDGCKSLSQVTLQEGLTTIAKRAFSRCSRLQKITFPESLTTIGEAAFFQCDLKELFLPNSLQTIADGTGYNDNPAGVFSHNTNLTKVVFQGEDTQIGSYAFYGCSALSQVTLPKGITTISAATFMGCSSLSSIALPESLAVIEGGAFFGCGLESIVFPQSLQIIADAVDKLGVPNYDYHGAFENNSKLTKITIPNKVTSIGSWAFEQCTSLSEVILPEGLTTIGDKAFNYCSSLKTIQLPKTVSSISTAFAYSGLVEIEIPERVTALSNAFNGCSQLKNVILPPTITSIGDNTFKDCKSLPTIALPQSLTAIGKSAFEGCSSLEHIVIPNQVKTIGSTAFKNCRVLREITIPDKVTTINSNVFQDCSALTSITLPNDITTIGYQAFQNCYSLRDIILPENLTTIDSYAFEMCKSLHSIIIPNKVTTLNIEVFDGCVGLSNITMLPFTPPTIDYRTFNGVPSNLKVNLICGSKEAYMANANWAKLSLNEISSNILTVKSNDNRMGEAYIPTPNTCENDTAIIEALPREGYQFAAWHDGNTDNPRTILVTQDTTFTANFEPLTTYQLTVNYDPKQGHISGTGEYYPNEEATLTVTLLGGYRFKQWGDGNTDNPRTIVMTQDTTLEALFITGDYCGDDILYTFLNDTLALNGTGDMWNLSQYGWNMYADEVLALTLSDGITSLGTNAFMDLMFLSEVTIPASVKTIHKRAFENCRSLSSVMFAENSQLQTIDHWAFYECINLKALEIPEGVTTIGNGAFYGCAYLDSIVLPASMMSIADNSFAQCTKLSAMTVHAITPPAVDSKTFDNVNRAIPVYVPFGTGTIYRATPIWQEFDIREMGAESNDNKIFYTSTDGNIITLRYEAYFGANIISNTYENGVGVITFDGPVTIIGESAFSVEDSLTSITLPNTVTTIGESAFEQCHSLTSVTIPNSVTTIGDAAFLLCNSLKSITIPNSVTSIGGWAFQECSSLISITIPNSVTSLENMVFYDCQSLTSVTMSNNVTSIGSCAFGYCTSLTSITIPNSVTSIGKLAFYGCSSLASITIPESVTSIGEGTFTDCSSLTSVAIPNSVTSIEGGVFYGCSSLTSITIPESITSIGAEAFRYCESLTSITIPDGVTTIGDYTFLGCSSLTSVAIPNSVTSIEEDVFYGCSSLTSITIPESITSIGLGAFCKCISLASITIPSGVTSIGDRAFAECSSLTTFAIPNSVTSIGSLAFEYCSSLISVTIGSSVMSIGAATFDKCRLLDTIYCYGTTPPTVSYENTFYNYDATLYVPCEALDTYKADVIWGKFSNIQCLDAPTPSNSCEDIIELDWRNALPLSQLSSGWYKLYVGDIHANQSDITSLLINDLDCPATITRAFYAHCEDEEPLFEGSATYELGATQQTMTYADFANIVPAHTEFLYLNIESIFEDCTPPCEDVHAEEYATICYAETYIWNGQTYATEGAYTMTFYTNAGCDSTVTLFLTVLPATIIVEESVTINEEYLPYTWRDLQCYDTGTYTISTPFANYPYCDSVIYVLNLTVEAPNKCGDNLYWHYSNNTMTITGYGAMYDDPDLLSYRTQGWYPSRVTHVSLSNEITHIGDVAFADCANLTNIDIPTSVTSIGDGAFSWTGLQSITIPASVTELGEQVFEACNDLHTILYEGNPIAINNQTVHPLIGCVHLDTVITPAALWHCTAAEPALEARYGVPHKARYIEVTDGELTDQAVKYIAQNATTLEILDLTNATNTMLPYGAWSNSYQLSTLYLPQQIEVIPESMIEGGCRLLEIAIPAAVTEIGNYAFAGCVNVWRMTVDAVIPPKVYENTFDGISRSISVQVPASSEDLYREAAYWREFFVTEDAQQSPSKAQKILREDQILILRNGKVYTIMGQLITNE